MNRGGPGPASLRAMPGFQTQQSHGRNAPINAGRVPNGKLGGAANWAFGIPQGGAGAGLQQRNVTGTMNSFAQSLSGSQPATPLDPSEFPSLSGAPQALPQNPGQAVWNNAARLAQQGNTTRQQQSNASQSVLQQSSGSSHQDLFPSGQQFADGLDEFRHGAQGIGGQLQGSQPQTGNIEEFPPLGRDGVGQGQERRSSLMQGSGFGGLGGMGFATLSQPQRNPLANPLTSQQDRLTSPASAVLSNSRSPIQQGQNGTVGDKLNPIGSENRRQDEYGGQQDRGQQSSQEQQDLFAGRPPALGIDDGPASSYSQLSPQEKFSLAGLLGIIRHPSQDVAQMAIGHDLTGLGLDLNSQEPLHPNFATPFAPATPARPLETDFILPACYSVANVQPLNERIPSFSEETLFYIFYTRPRDIMQELVADELMGRKWRYHKIERKWVTRDESFPTPIEVEPSVSERGVYLWWDWESWKRVRREYVLRYDDLDGRNNRQYLAQTDQLAQQMNR